MLVMGESIGLDFDLASVGAEEGLLGLVLPAWLWGVLGAVVGCTGSQLGALGKGLGWKVPRPRGWCYAFEASRVAP